MLTLFCLIFAPLSYGGDSDDAEDELMHGNINYPFVGPSRPLAGPGQRKDDKLIVRSAVGNTEYQLEVPSALDDMDIEIPIVPLGGSSFNSGGSGIGARTSGLNNPSSADRELVGALPQIDQKYPSETGVLDKAFGTGPAGGYRQSPSYVMGIAKVNEHYRRREYEYAMVELNNLLAFYPNSPKLQKMKGTVLVRTGNLELAERAWVHAQQLEPDDAGLNQGLKQLQQRIAASKKIYVNRQPEQQFAPTGGAQPPTAASSMPNPSPQASALNNFKAAKAPPSTGGVQTPRLSSNAPKKADLKILNQPRNQTGVRSRAPTSPQPLPPNSARRKMNSAFR